MVDVNLHINVNLIQKGYQNFRQKAITHETNHASQVFRYFKLVFLVYDRECGAFCNIIESVINIP